MDELLKLQPQAKENERKALFGLIDRFSASIETYRKQYFSISQQKATDLANIQKGNQLVLQTLTNTQEAEKNRARSEYDRKMKEQTEAENRAKEEASARLQQLENDYSSYEKNEIKKLDAMTAQQHQKSQEWNELLSRVRDIYVATDRDLGYTVLRKNKLQAIVSSRNINKTVGDLKEARELLTEGTVNRAQSLHNEIHDITVSLPKKIIFHAKRDGLVVDLSSILGKMQSAITLMGNDQVNRLNKSSQESSLNRQAYRKRVNSEKADVITNRDQTVAAIQQKKKQITDTYNMTRSNLESRHQQEYQKRKTECEAQLKQKEENWNNTLKNCSVKFANDMIQQYPPAEFTKWMQKFWYYPRRVEDYNKVQGTQMNMLIGIAEVDISSWYSGGSGPMIQKVLSKYLLLFGTDAETAKKNYYAGKLYLPYHLSIEEGDSVLLSYDENNEERVKNIMNALGMRMLRSVPASLMNFLLVDYVGIGAFGRLMALDPAHKNNASEPIVKSIAIGENASVHKSDIPQQINDLTIKMSDLSHQLINYPSLRVFNEQNELSKSAYRPLLMMNFPAGLSVNEIKTLDSMSTQCNKWGFSMVLAQPDKELAAAKPDMKMAIEELYKKVRCLRVGSSGQPMKITNPEFVTEKNASIQLYGLPAADAVDQIADEIRTANVAAGRVKIDFLKAKGVCPTSAELYSQKSNDGISVPIGYLEGGLPFKLPFDDKHVHTMILGNTGSGKTNLLHVLMTNLMLRYEPSEVQVYLIDFKYGKDFRIYTQYNLPNFQSISISDDPEFALAILDYLEEEAKRRSDRMGAQYQKISDYNAKVAPEQKMSRIFLIVDELYELVQRASEDIQKEIVTKINSFVHQFRAFGIHVIVSGQDLNKIDMFDTICSQCATRLALHCSDEQVKALLSEDAVARMHAIASTDQGAGVYTLDGGKQQGTEHTALLTDVEHAQCLQQIQNHYLAKKQYTQVKVLLTKISNNPNHPIQAYIDHGRIPKADNNMMYIGDPISLERKLNFHPQGNIWILGGLEGDAEKAANSLMLYATLSLTLEKLETKNIDIYCTNFNDSSMRSEEDEENDRFGQLTSKVDRFYTYTTGDRFLEVMNHLLDEMESREMGSKPTTKALWWFVARPELLESDGAIGQTAIQLQNLLRNGVKQNIHVVLWTADIKAAQKFMLTRDLLKERICLEAPAEDLKSVNGQETKRPPEGYKAAYVGKNYKSFRVYDLPDGAWMDNLLKRLASQQ